MNRAINRVNMLFTAPEPIATVEGRETFTCQGDAQATYLMRVEIGSVEIDRCAVVDFAATMRQLSVAFMEAEESG